MKEELRQLVKKSEYGTLDFYYLDRDEYKQINAMFLKDQKQVIRILREMIMNPDQNEFERDNTMNIFCFLLYMYKKHDNNNVDMTYLESQYRRMIFDILEKDSNSSNRNGLVFFINIIFTPKEMRNVFEKYLKTETDPKNIAHFKYILLLADVMLAFPGQGFRDKTTMFELGVPTKNRIAICQTSINNAIKENGENIVREFLKMFFHHEYTKETSRIMLRQIKIG